MVGWRALCLLLVVSSVLGCSGAKPGDTDLGYDNQTTDPPPPDPLEASTIEDDSGVFDLGGRQNDGGDASRPEDDASVPVADAGPAQPCTTPIGPGDVKVVELMIASASGSGDHGEWVELVNTRSCILDVGGLSIESPRGTGKDSATVPQSLLIAPGAAFVVADYADAQSNHGIPIVAAAWNDYDVLKNDGDTVSVYAGSTLIDSITYPKLTLVAGRSVAFPADCAWGDRADWARWSLSFHVWSSPYEGTPGADNSDVTCY
jgi:hypothetical protein